MAYKKITPYVRSQQPADPKSATKYAEQELVKLEKIIAELIVAIEELRAKNP